MNREYLESVYRIDSAKENTLEIQDVIYRLQTQKVYCYKYNHAMDPSVQNHKIFEATIELSPDGTELIITNKKPVSDPEYILEPDPNVVKAQVKMRKNQMEYLKSKVSKDFQMSKAGSHDRV